jgi:hypothetical protein
MASRPTHQGPQLLNEVADRPIRSRRLLQQNLPIGDIIRSPRRQQPEAKPEWSDQARAPSLD